MSKCNTICMSIFPEELSNNYPNDQIVLVSDGAAWHKSEMLKCFKNITIVFIPPYTPKMNPIEQIWKGIRKIGFRNEVFQALGKVIDRLCNTICSLSSDIVKKYYQKRLDFINVLMRN